MSDNAAARIEQQLQAAFDRVVSSAVEHTHSDTCLVVAYSGGLDSRVLLQVAAQWVENNLPATVLAVYVDHGLQAESVAWSQHCAAICAEIGVPFSSVSVKVNGDSGLSPEDAARRARYDALQQHITSGDCLLTAHHADDQAETILLQALRGAGVRGLSSMPERRAFGAGALLRPFLSIRREALLAYADANRLEWIEDPSNRDNGFNRNLLRNTVLPSLRQRWPAMATSLARSAAHCADSAELNRQLALVDLGEAIETPVLPLQHLLSLKLLRRKNAIRAWVEFHGFQVPSAAQLDRINTDIILAATDSAGAVSFGQAKVCRYGADLYLGDRSAFAASKPFSYVWNDIRKSLHLAETGQTLTIADLDLPWLGSRQSLLVCSRQGGERIRLQGHDHSKSVKTLLQQHRIPPWHRDKLPFVYLNGALVGVVGIGFSGPSENNS